MDRADLQRLADVRAEDAAVLLAAGRWSAAYYLAGYAVECGLKACIAKLVRAGEFPDLARVRDSYTHQIETLVTLAGLIDRRKIDFVGRPLFFQNWVTAKDWSESARYAEWDEATARKLVQAVSDPKDGVLPWVKLYW